MFHEVEADLAVIEAAVDMGRLGVQKPFRPHGLGESDEEPHGEADGLPGGALDVARSISERVRAMQDHSPARPPVNRSPERHGPSHETEHLTERFYTIYK